MNKRIFYIVTIILLSFIILFLFIKKNKINNTNEEEFKNPVNILFITDNNYVMPVTTTIRSIIANKNKQTQIQITIIGVDLSYYSILKLQKIAKKDVKVELIDIESTYLKNLSDGKYSNAAVSRADNTKLFLTSIIKDKDKILYIDGDIIILKDLSEFYNINLDDYYIGAVDDWQTKKRYDKNKRYFNNGIMLLNLKAMRKDNTDDKLFKAKQQDKNPRFVTQDAFNTVMENKVYFMPLIYNTFAPEYDNNNINMRIKEVLGKNYNPQTYPYKNDKEYRKGVVAIHYCGWGNIKPWWQIDFSRKTNRIWYKYAPLYFWLDCIQGKCKIPY